MNPRILLASVMLIGLTMATAAQPKVSNREAKPDEVGYRPADGATAVFNPPSFVWLHEPGAVTYDIQGSADEAFSETQIVEGIPWNTYTPHETARPGTFWWRYRYTDAKGQKSDWSVARRITIPEDAIAFPMPSRAQQKERVPEQHPRLFVRPEELPKLRELAKGREAKVFEGLVRSAERYIAAGPTSEPDKMGSARNKEDAEAVKYWWPNREQTMKACQEAEVIAFVYLITKEKKYGEAARKWVMHLASWNPDGPTNFALNCEAAKPLLYRLPRAYDWAYDALSDADREVVRKVMQRRINDAWVSGEVGRGTGHINRPYSSHGNRVWHKIAEAGIAFLGEVPEAETWLDYAVNKFYAIYPVWSDEDGGWHEGVSYWSGYMSKAVWWMQFADKAMGIDGLKKPFFAHVGDFPMYVAPPGSPSIGFGDLSHRPMGTGAGPFMDYFIRAKGARSDGGNARYWRWWTEAWKMPGQDDGILGFLYHASLPEPPAAKEPTDLPQSKVFRGIGVAALNTTLLDARENLQVLFKSSPFGTQSHGHNAHNSFQLSAYGEVLFPACTYRDLHGSKFHYQYVHSTRSQNAMLVDGEGQIKHTAAPHGKIVHSQLTETYDHVVGDATAAYGGRLTRYRRHVVLLKPDVVVIYDDVAAAKPSTYQFMLHALKEFAVDEQAGTLSVEMPKAGVRVKYLSATPLKFRQWDGYEPKPTKEFPNQWHVETSTTSPAEGVGMVTVMVPHRAGKGVAWEAERFENEREVGVRVKGMVVKFPKGGSSDQARIERAE